MKIWSLAVITILLCAFAPQQRTALRGLHKKYNITAYEENKHPVFSKYLPTLPQYKIWVKRKRQMKAWLQQYAFLPLPDSAVIIDEKVLTTAHGKRTIVAWMTGSDVYLAADEDMSAYASCTGSVCGSGYFYGMLHFTLVNTAAASMINTIAVKSVNEGELPYPFAIANPLFQPNIFGIIYTAIGGDSIQDGAADIMHFIDFNGDGKASEFALFDMDGCTPPYSTLISYNEKTDVLKWVNWKTTLKYTVDFSRDTTEVANNHWMFSAMRARMTNYKLNFEENLMGRGSDYFRLYLRYNPANDAYTGIVDATQIPGDTLPAGQKLETSLEIRRRLKIR